MPGNKPEIPTDTHGWPLLSQEEREFLEDRGWDVRMSLADTQIAAHASTPEERRYYNKARFELDRVLKPWGGDPVWQATPWGDRVPSKVA